MNTRKSQKSSMSSLRASLSTSSTLINDFVFILLDGQYYMAGDKATGEILLSVQDQSNNPTLLFTCKGEETLTIYDPNDSTKIISDKKNQVFLADFPIYQSEVLLPGQYVFPFSLKIPSHSPSSFKFSGAAERGLYLKVLVEYEISVSLNSDSRFSHKKQFIVKNKLSLASPHRMVETVENIKGCCGGSGYTKFILRILNNEHPEVGGDVSFRLEPDNQDCNAPINRVVAKVFAEFSVQSELGEVRIIKEVSSFDRASWVGARSSMVYEKDFEFKSKLLLGDDEFLCSNITPLINCEYFVTVLVYYDSFCGSRTCVVKIPFHVDPCNNLVKDIPKLPENWNPIENSITAFVWDGIKGFEMRGSVKLSSN